MTTFNMKWDSLRDFNHWDPTIVRIMIFLACITAIGSAALMTHPFSIWNWEIIAKGVAFFAFSIVVLVYIMIAIVPADGVSRSLRSPLAMFYMMICLCWMAIITCVVRGFLHWW